MTEATTAPETSDPAVLPARMMTPQVIHEDLFGKLAEFVGETLKGDVIAMPEPGTGVYAPFLNTKDGFKVIPACDWDAYRENPRWRTGKASLLDLSSFIAHVNRFKDRSSIVFANNARTNPSVTAMLDYHDDVTEEGALPRHGRHRSFHAFPLSDEWQAWVQGNGVKMNMAQFAMFLEDRYVDVMPVGGAEFGEVTQRFIDAQGGTSRIASPITLLELSRNFHVNESATIKQGTNLSSGEGGIVLESEHTDAAGVRLQIPTMFVVFIPVFKGGEGYPIIARLRYRARSGDAPSFWYELWRSDLIFDKAFDEALERVRGETGLPVLLGSPEA